MTEQQKLLQERLDQNYAAYITGLQGKTAEELITLAPEITAAQQLRDELACACSEEVVAYLLQLDDPLAEIRGFWADQQDSCYSEEIGHMICELQNRGLIPDEDILPPPQVDKGHVAAEQQMHEQAQNITSVVMPPQKKPFMQLSGRDSNILSLMYTASQLLLLAGMRDQNREMIDRVTACCDEYDKALNIICEYVDTERSGHSHPQKSVKKKGMNAHER